MTEAVKMVRDTANGGFRMESIVSEADNSDWHKMRAEVQKFPFMLIVGEEEEKNGTISVRRHGDAGKSNQSMTIEEFAALIQEEINKTLKQF